MSKQTNRSWWLLLAAIITVGVGTSAFAQEQNKYFGLNNRSPVTANESLGLNTAPTSLAGTYWNVMLMTEKGQTEKGTGAPGPDVELCRNGNWGMLHYGGAREAGTYQVQGSRLIMKLEDGSLFGNFQIKRNGNEMTLDDGKYVLRLKYIRPAGC